jgi:hypothetical protein
MHEAAKQSCLQACLRDFQAYAIEAPGSTAQAVRNKRFQLRFMQQCFFE